MNHAPISTPIILDLSKASDRRTFASLIKRRKVQHTVDDFEEQEKELFAVEHPRLVFSGSFDTAWRKHHVALEKRRPARERGRWAYFPWTSTLVHILEDKKFQKVRTARNRDLITEEEQQKFYNATIGIGGLSVGNSVALAIVLQGGGRRLRLADHDRLALSNLNRIRGSVAELGLPKTEMTARQIYLLDPYAKLELFSEGLNEKNIKKFCEGLDLVIDEMDNLAMKFLLRVEARRLRLPMLMAADNGDNGVVDVERYDLDPRTRFFHGRMGNVTYEGLAGLDKFGIGKMITKLVGSENVTERMQRSLLAMGKTVVSWPQLGGAALLNGSAVAYCARKILNKQPVESDRALVLLDEKLVPGYGSPAAKRRRKKVSDNFRSIFGL